MRALDAYMSQTNDAFHPSVRTNHISQPLEPDPSCATHAHTHQTLLLRHNRPYCVQRCLRRCSHNLRMMQRSGRSHLWLQQTINDPVVARVVLLQNTELFSYLVKTIDMVQLGLLCSVSVYPQTSVSEQAISTYRDIHCIQCLTA